MKFLAQVFKQDEQNKCINTFKDDDPSFPRNPPSQFLIDGYHFLPICSSLKVLNAYITNLDQQSNEVSLVTMIAYTHCSSSPDSSM